MQAMRHRRRSGGQAGGRCENRPLGADCVLVRYLNSWSVVMATGTVKWFNSQKGYGFIQPQGGGGKDVFVHISAVEKAGLSGLNEGQIVQYEEVSNKGKTSAENLKVK
jgi:cold shock protein